VLYTGTPHDAAHISLGCDPNEYTAAGVTGMLVVVKRGTCARVARPIFGQQAGAAAVVMINNAAGLPPFEGEITVNPDTGIPYHVTIPFLGVTNTDDVKFVAADGTSAALSDSGIIANPGYLTLASFTSGGPVSGDSAMKPEVTGPGVSIVSAGMATGTGGANFSGTSMAAPHTTGEAALVKQAHPAWQARYWRAAIVNTADPALVANYSTRVAGVGHIQALPATQTDVVALGDNSTPDLNFGWAQLTGDFSATHTVTLTNFGATPINFDVTVANTGGLKHTLTPSASSVLVPAGGGTATVDVTLAVKATAAGDGVAFNTASGLVEFTPTTGSNHDVKLRVPYLLVPSPTSNVTVSIKANKLGSTGDAKATLTNVGGIKKGHADWYAWGINDPLGDVSYPDVDLRAVGVQSFAPSGPIVFAIKTAGRWSNAAMNEYDIYIDVDGDGTDDYDVVAADQGALTAGVYNGVTAVAVFDLAAGTSVVKYKADAPMNGSTILLPVDVAQLCNATSPCLSADNPRITYHVESFGWNGGHDVTITPAKFNAFTPAISNGMFDTVRADTTQTTRVHLDMTEYPLSPPLGLMIVTHENPVGREAQTISVTVP
jgi:minor extracellular serine protease Vpr